MKYQNPVIPGFYPDPSICRDGDDFYLVTSSFEFFPGVPLFHSRDLVNWQQLGHVLTRPSQLPLASGGISSGVYAPTLRVHNGRYYMITTIVGCSPERPLNNFYVWADSIEGPWSDPILIDQVGIDPSLFWDQDGTAYYIGTHIDEKGQQCIGQFAIDLQTGKRLTPTRPIWYGTGGKNPEGPHMYYIHGKYYLMIAEGGTEYGHMETIACSDSVWGPFTPCPRNPILSHRDINGTNGFGPQAGPGAFQGLGHADLTQDAAGNWWMVFHAIRPTQGQLHHIGRETMLAPVTWDEEGWPVINSGNLITAIIDAPGKAGNESQDGFALQPNWSLHVDFVNSHTLSPRFTYLRNPEDKNYQWKNGLVLTAGNTCLDEQGSPTFIGIRQQHFSLTASTVLDFDPQESQEAGITVFHTNEQHYDLSIQNRSGKRCALLRRRVGDMITETAPIEIPGSTPVRLEIQADRLHYRFLAGSGETLIPVGTGSTQLLSTECSPGTFTGCFIGLYCQGNGSSRFLKFEYQPEAQENL